MNCDRLLDLRRLEAERVRELARLVRLKPMAGSKDSLKIASGSFAATSSISMPPGLRAINDGPADRAVEHDARGRAPGRCRAPPRRAAS